MQIAIITGSGQGVGAAAAQLFAQHGAKVVVTDIDACKSDQVRRQRELQLARLVSAMAACADRI